MSVKWCQRLKWNHITYTWSHDQYSPSGREAFIAPFTLFSSFAFMYQHCLQMIKRYLKLAYWMYVCMFFYLFIVQQSQFVRHQRGPFGNNVWCSCQDCLTRTCWVDQDVLTDDTLDNCECTLAYLTICCKMRHSWREIKRFLPLFWSLSNRRRDYAKFVHSKRSSFPSPQFLPLIDFLKKKN